MGCPMSVSVSEVSCTSPLLPTSGSVPLHVILMFPILLVKIDIEERRNVHIPRTYLHIGSTRTDTARVGLNIS